MIPWMIISGKQSSKYIYITKFSFFYKMHLPCTYMTTFKAQKQALHDDLSAVRIQKERKIIRGEKNLQIAECKIQIADCRLQITDYRMQNADCRLQKIRLGRFFAVLLLRCFTVSVFRCPASALLLSSSAVSLPCGHTFLQFHCPAVAFTLVLLFSDFFCSVLPFSVLLFSPPTVFQPTCQFMVNS